MGVRYDTGELMKAERLVNGWIRAPAYIARTGILTYRTDSGTRRELRLPEDVFSPASLQSFAMSPVTLSHPPEMLTSDNVHQYQKGQLGDCVERSGDKVAVNLLITHQDAVSRVLEGVVELSAGYTCDFDPTPGVWQGQQYDGIQKNIRGNHVAIVPSGRAGPEVGIRMDSDSAVELVQDDASPGERGNMLTPEEIAALQKELEAVKKDRDVQKGRADSSEKLLVAEKKLRADAADPGKLSEKVRARVALLTEAAKIAPELKCDALDDMQVQMQALERFDASYKEILSGKSPEYVQGVFETATRRPTSPATFRVDTSDGFFSRTDAKYDPATDPVAQFNAALDKQQEGMR